MPPTWNTGSPQNTDAIKNGPRLIRNDKLFLKEKLQEEHDFPASGKHKNISIISGNLTLHSGISLVQVGLGNGVSSYTASGLDEPDAEYAVFFETSWGVAAAVTEKETNEFTITFLTKTPDALQKISWMIIRSGA